MLDVKTYFKRHFRCQYIFVKELSKIAEKSKAKRIYDNEGNLISKECSCCHKIKPVSEFHKCEKAKDGLKSRCKKCRNERRRKKKPIIRNYDDEGNLISKECTHCHKIKPVSKFSKDKNKTDGLQCKCKECDKEYEKKHKQEKKKYRKEYYQKNKDREKNMEKKYRQENKKYRKEYKKEYDTKKRQEALQQIKTEVETNPEKYNYIEGKEIYGIIYLVHNIESNRYYVGQTTVGFDNRYPKGWLYDHKHKNFVKHDMELYGKDSFEYIKIFKVAHSQYELDKLEAYYIDYYNSFENGYNENRGNIFTDRGKEK